MERDMQKGNRMTKITWQYTESLPEETMDFLRGIAAILNHENYPMPEKAAGLEIDIG